MLVLLQEDLQEDIDKLQFELDSGKGLGPTPLALHSLLVKYRERVPESLKQVTLQFAEDLQRKSFVDAEEDLINVRIIHNLINLISETQN